VPVLTWSSPPLSQQKDQPHKKPLFFSRQSRSQYTSTKTPWTLSNYRLAERTTLFANYSRPIGNMAENQVTAALSGMSLKELPPRLPNFPLPRELHDQ